MTLNKAVNELIEELQKSDLSEEDKEALKKYQSWLLGVKGTVSSNTEYWETGDPTLNGNFVVMVKSFNGEHEYLHPYICYWDNERGLFRYWDEYCDKNEYLDDVVKWHRIRE